MNWPLILAREISEESLCGKCDERDSAIDFLEPGSNGWLDFSTSFRDFATKSDFSTKPVFFVFGGPIWLSSIYYGPSTVRSSPPLTKYSYLPPVE
jgi:hypothetical protein